MDGLRARGLVGADGWLTASGRETHRRIEHRTDVLAAEPYRALTETQRVELVSVLEPIVAAVSDAHPH